MKYSEQVIPFLGKHWWGKGGWEGRLGQILYSLRARRTLEGARELPFVEHMLYARRCSGCLTHIAHLDLTNNFLGS